MDLLYLPPVAGEYLQGDIFDEFPSIFVESRPLRVARFWKEQGGRSIWGVHTEGEQAPAGGFRWRMEEHGESAVLAHGYLGMAMLISHDCEIENDPAARTLAMIRPLAHLDETTQRTLFSGREEDVNYAIFPLDAQDGEPRIERSFVDFRRLTTVRPQVLEASLRIASASEELRRAVAAQFQQYLFRRVGPPAGSS